MGIRASWRRRRARGTWRDPGRKHRTLLSFAGTEEDGGKDLQRAARRIADAELRGHLERHAADERRHAALFRERAAAFAAEHGIPVGAGVEADRPYDLSGARPGLELDAHGFFNAGLVDELGELRYVAMLHVAERRAAELFASYRDLNDRDPATQRLFADVLQDEKYHVAYTGRFLEQWRRAGRAAEVDAALGEARGHRLWDAWKRLGVRSASGFAQALLLVLYWTLLAPFALLARLREPPSGWQEPRPLPEPARRGGEY